MTKIQIRKGTVAEVVHLSHQIPEFINPYSEEVYSERLQDKPHLILIAESERQSVGFKVGYQKDSDIFYSWMGGVLPDYRRMNIATALADGMEAWAKDSGYSKIFFKTRNRLTVMLHFSLGRGFMITDIIRQEEIGEHRIVLEKSL
jgi:ribosomal protein S18 acetylase RimI-like enzyme